MKFAFRAFLVLALGVCLAPCVSAETFVPSPHLRLARSTGVTNQTLHDFAKETGIPWEILHLDQRGLVMRVSRSYPGANVGPAELTLQEGIEWAARFLVRNGRYFGITSGADLVLFSAQQSWPKREERPGDYDIHVAFSQALDEVPVDGTFFLVSMTHDGGIYLIKAHTVPILPGWSRAILGPTEAIHFAQAVTSPDAQPQSIPKLVFQPFFNAFAWTINFGYPWGVEVYVDASTGAILDERPNTVAEPITDAKISGSLVDHDGVPLERPRFFIWADGNVVTAGTADHGPDLNGFDYNLTNGNTNLDYQVQMLLKTPKINVFDANNILIPVPNVPISDSTEPFNLAEGEEAYFLFDLNKPFTTWQDTLEGGTAYREYYRCFYFMKDCCNFSVQNIDFYVNMPLSGALGASSGPTIAFLDGAARMDGPPRPDKRTWGKVMMHELGHSVHHGALGGHTPTNRCPGHYGSSPSCNDPGCSFSSDCSNHGNNANKCSCDALTEGWADFFGVAVYADINPDDDWFTYYPNGQESLELNLGPNQQTFARNENLVDHYLWDVLDNMEDDDKDHVDLNFSDIFVVIQRLAPYTMEEVYEDLWTRYPASYRGFNELMEARGFRFKLEEFMVEEGTGNGDGKLDPGETVNVYATLSNLFFGQPQDLRVRMDTNSPYATIETPEVSFNPMVPAETNDIGYTTNYDQNVTANRRPFVVRLSQNIPSGAAVELSLALAGDHEGVLGNLSFRANLREWFIDGRNFTSPKGADLDGDGKKDVVYAVTRDYYAYNLSGEQLPNWKRSTLSVVRSTAAIGDIDGDGQVEVAGASLDEKLYAWKRDATLLPSWPVTLPNEIWVAPTLADLNGDGKLEVISGCSDGKVYAYKSNGVAVTGWPVDAGGSVQCSVAVGDLDKDGKLWVVAVAKLAATGSDPRYGRVSVFNSRGQMRSGFPVQIDAWSDSDPALADLSGDGKPEIIFGCGNNGGSNNESNAVYVLKSDGTHLTGWPFKDTGTKPFTSSPALGDLDGSAGLEILIGREDGTVHIFRPNGTELPGWPVDIGSRIIADPVIADVDNDGANEAIIGANDHQLHAFNADGTEAAGFPVDLGTTVLAAPFIEDFDGDGKLDVAVSNDTGGMFVFGLETPATRTPPWGQFQKDLWNTGSYEPLPTSSHQGYPVALAGYFGTDRVDAALGGTLSFQAFPLGGDAVELGFGGTGAGVFLKDDGTSGDFVAGDGLYGLSIAIPPASGIAPGRYPLELQAWNGAAGGDRWPWLTVQ